MVRVFRNKINSYLGLLLRIYHCTCNEQGNVVFASLCKNIIGDVDNFETPDFEPSLLQSFPLSTIYEALTMLQVTAGERPFAFADDRVSLDRLYKRSVAESRGMLKPLAKGLKAAGQG